MIESVICYNITLRWSTINCAVMSAINIIFKQATKITKNRYIKNIIWLDDMYMYVKYVHKKVKCVVSMDLQNGIDPISVRV